MPEPGSASESDSAPGSVSAIVPVYNEIETLEVSLRRLHGFLTESGLGFEIVIVESGSTDGTGAACDRLAQELPSMAVVHEGGRNGFGSALRQGFAEARMDLIWVVPVDLPFPLETLLQALPLFAEHDAVLSYRASDHRSWIRRCQSFFFAALSRALLDLPVRTVNSAFKVYRTKQIKALPLRETHWLLDAEVVYRLNRAGARLAEIPVPLLDRELGTSKVTPLDSIRILLRLVVFRRALARAETATLRARPGPATADSASRESAEP